MVGWQSLSVAPQVLAKATVKETVPMLDGGSDLKDVSWDSRAVRGAGSLNPDSSSLSSVRLGSGTPCRQRRSDIGCVSGEAWISAMSACSVAERVLAVRRRCTDKGY